MLSTDSLRVLDSAPRECQVAETAAEQSLLVCYLTLAPFYVDALTAIATRSRAPGRRFVAVCMHFAYCALVLALLRAFAALASCQ